MKVLYSLSSTDCQPFLSFFFIFPGSKIHHIEGRDWDRVKGVHDSMMRQMMGRKLNLQKIRKSLVQTAHLRGNAEVNSTITDFNDKSANDIGVDLFLLSIFQHLTKGSGFQRDW